jgi:hypothetical protein
MCSSLDSVPLKSKMTAGWSLRSHAAITSVTDGMQKV